MHHSETVSKGLFFKVVESGITNLIQRSISKNLQEGLVINCNYKIVTSQNKISCLVKGICHRQSLPLNWCISRFRRVGKSTTHQCDFPYMSIAKKGQLMGMNNVSEKAKSLCHLYSKACRFSLIKDLYPIGNFSSNYGFGFLK